MFTLTIDNNQLILDPDFGVPLMYKNPCWCFNEIPGPLCLDVTIPDNDVTRNRLNFPGRFAKMAKSNDRKFPGVELRWNGYLYIYGTLVITKPTAKGYSGYIQSELRNLSDAQRQRLIGDHMLSGTLNFENKPNYDPDTDKYCTIKLHNAGFWTDKGESEDYTNAEGEKTTREVLTRKFENTANFFVNATDANGVIVTAGTDQAIAVSPFPFLHRLIDMLLRENRLFMRNNFLSSDAALKTLCLYHNHSICKSDYDVAQILYNLPGTYHVPFKDFYENYMLTVLNDQTWFTSFFNMSKLLPSMKLNELLLSVQNLTNTFFFVSGIDDVDCIDRESLFDMQPFDLSKYRVSRWLPGTRQNLCLQFKMDHDSDDQEFNENFKDITSREDDIKDPVEYYPDLQTINFPEIGEIRLVTSQKMYYEYRQETIDNKNVLMWAPYSLDLQDLKYNPTGDDSEPIETQFSTLRMHESGFPIAFQKGNSSQFAQFTENFTPRLMFYNGNNTGGATATNGLSLEWKNLVSNRFRRTAPFYANALPLEADFRFPGNILYKILNEIYIPFLDSEGSFFIKEMEIRATNSEYVDATLTVFKNEDNVFTGSTGTVDGSGEHVGSVFVPKLVGVTETGRPILLNASGQQRPMPVFGDISTSQFSKITCIDYDQTGKLLFVGGNNGQLHICDLSDIDNLRYKTIQIYTGPEEISAVGLVNNGGTKHILLGRDKQPSEVWALPYLADFDAYASSQAVRNTNISNGDDCLRGFLFVDNYYYGVTTGGEMFRTNNLANQWSQVFDTHDEYIRLAATQTRIWVVELNDRLRVAQRSNPTAYDLTGMAGDPLQKVRDLQPLAGDRILFVCDDNNKSVWEVDPANNINRNITPSAFQNAGGICFDGVKYAYIGVKDALGYTKIAQYNSAPVIPEAVWSYISVPSFFTKLFIY